MKKAAGVATVIGGVLIQDAVVDFLEDIVRVEAKRLKVPYWAALAAVGLILVAAD